MRNRYRGNPRGAGEKGNNKGTKCSGVNKT